MRCAIMQPTFLPWLGYFDLIRSVDIFVLLDHVQFEKQSWQQRNRIRSKTGDILLTVPIIHSSDSKNIKDVRIDITKNFVTKHLKTILLAYSSTLNFSTIYEKLERIYLEKNIYLIDLNLKLLNLGIQCLGLTKEIKFSSEIDVQGKRVEALVDICKKVGADNYLSPVGSKAYIDENNIFEQNNIKLEYQQFNHPVYKQKDYSDFISHLSFIDYLFNVPTEQAVSFGTI